jgi:hypothetical protein
MKKIETYHAGSQILMVCFNKNGTARVQIIDVNKTFSKDQDKDQDFSLKIKTNNFG